MTLTIVTKTKQILADTFVKPGHWDAARFLNAIGYMTGIAQSVKVLAGFITNLPSGRSIFTKKPVKGFSSVPATILVY